MRKVSILKILFFSIIVIAIGALIGILLGRGPVTAKTKEEVCQVLKQKGNHIIEITSWVVPVEEVVEEVVQEHNQIATEGDVLTIYRVEENIYWIASINGYKYDIARFRVDLAGYAIDIKKGIIQKATIQLIYATTEQQKEYEESLFFWKDHVENRAKMQILEEKKGEVTIATVILTSKDFVEGEVPNGTLPIFFLQLTEIFVKIQ